MIQHEKRRSETEKHDDEDDEDDTTDILAADGRASHIRTLLEPFCTRGDSEKVGGKGGSYNTDDRNQ